MKRIEYDVLFVGGGISSLSAAHRLVDLARQEKASLRIAVLEKGKDFGSHILSGAVSNPRSIKKLFPDYEINGFPVEGRCSESHVMMLGRKKAWEIPSFISPPEMNKAGYLILSLSDVVKWMASSLVKKVKDSPSIIVDLYNGFPATEVIYNGSRIEGVKVDSTGIVENDNCYSKVAVFGDKGFISRGIIAKFNLAQLPQKWAVGVKEIWETQNDFSGRVWHTIGYPLLDGSYGGGFMYGLKDKKIAIGMIVGFDSENPALHPPQMLQNLKKHPWVQEMIKGGKILKYGAAIIPEGGYYSLPIEFSVDGAMLIGDALGVLNLKGFSGIDNSMESGMTAAEVIFEAAQKRDFSIGTLGQFKQRLMESRVGKELKSSRYYRCAFYENKKIFSDYLPKILNGLDESGIIIGCVKTFLGDPSGTIGSAINLKKMMSGATEMGVVKWQEDRTYSKADYKTKGTAEPEGFDKTTIYSTADVVFYASTHYHHGNRHIDELSADTCRRCIQRYHSHGNEAPCVGDCTAEVHQIHSKDNDKFHFMNLENCVQCCTCEIVCPENNLKVNPAEHGSGPDFSGL
jgi:electron-transferring-flavoprotein dehydrogenase